MKKEINFLLKINTFGVIFTIIVIMCNIIAGIYGLATCNYEVVFYYNNLNDRPLPIQPGSSVLLLFGSEYTRLLGIITGGLYLHNISMPIYTNSKNPEHNIRDMFIGFTIVGLSYIVIGVLGCIGF